MKKHIESYEKDCEHCIELIKAPMPRIFPYLESHADKKKRKLMEKIIDYQFSQIKNSKVLRTPFGTLIGALIWSPKKPKNPTKR